jgi:hypothetical protein
MYTSERKEKEKEDTCWGCSNVEFMTCAYRVSVGSDGCITTENATENAVMIERGPSPIFYASKALLPLIQYTFLVQ